MTAQAPSQSIPKLKLSQRARKASEAYIQCDSLELFAKLQGYTIESARVALSRWRSKYGESYFPYKRPQSTRSQITDITSLSQTWKKHSVAEAAAILGFPTPGSLRSYIVQMRRDHGEVLFPHKRKPSEVRSFANERLLLEASKLWKENVVFLTICKRLSEDPKSLADKIKQDRVKNGLSNFPYRGVMV